MVAPGSDMLAKTPGEQRDVVFHDAKAMVLEENVSKRTKESVPMGGGVKVQIYHVSRMVGIIGRLIRCADIPLVRQYMSVSG
jgi:hypothetical protein